MDNTYNPLYCVDGVTVHPNYNVTDIEKGRNLRVQFTIKGPGIWGVISSFRMPDGSVLIDSLILTIKYDERHIEMRALYHLNDMGEIHGGYYRTRKTEREDKYVHIILIQVICLQHQ
jgi:hypothetical protein